MQVYILKGTDEHEHQNADERLSDCGSVFATLAAAKQQALEEANMSDPDESLTLEWLMNDDNMPSEWSAESEGWYWRITHREVQE